MSISVRRTNPKFMNFFWTLEKLQIIKSSQNSRFHWHSILLSPNRTALLKWIMV